MRQIIADRCGFDQFAPGAAIARLVVNLAIWVFHVRGYPALILFRRTGTVIGYAAHQEIVKPHLETVALVRSQHQGTRPLAFAKFDKPGRLAQVGIIHSSAVSNRRVARKNHVAAKCKQHARRNKEPRPKGRGIGIQKSWRGNAASGEEFTRHD